MGVLVLLVTFVDFMFVSLKFVLFDRCVLLLRVIVLLSCLLAF